MAKKGNRVQVILECTEHKTMESQEHLVTSPPRTKKHT